MDDEEKSQVKKAKDLNGKREICKDTSECWREKP